jgi:hypothetical protein
MNVEPITENPPPELIQQLVREARDSAAGLGGKRGFSDAQDKERAEVNAKKAIEGDGALVSFFASFTDNEKGYGGYSASMDEQCFAIMQQAGVTPTPADIMVMPGNAGMSLQTGSIHGEGNRAVAVMSEDQARTFRTVAMTDYGPGKFQGTPPCYRRLLERIQVGTILVSESLLGEDFALKGTIWHECGHKYLGDPNESGAVFFREITLMRNNFGADRARKWTMEVGRTPAYHRAYGLRTDPGRRDLLLLLQEICTPKEFYQEFNKQYLEIIGEELSKPDAVIEEEKLKVLEQSLVQRMDVRIGTKITGKLATLKEQLAGYDLAGARGGVRPGGALLGDIVTFAGMKWRLLDKKPGNIVVFELECVDLDDGLGVTQRSTVWARTEGSTTTFGLLKEGPWPYADLPTAERDQEIAVQVVAQTMEKYAKADMQTVHRLAVEQVLKTRENQ